VRIISGSHRGRKIIAPKNLPVRPTTDLAKEGLFNILYNYFHFEQVEVLELFAGTGNIAYEFASRGSKNIIAVDINLRCISFIDRMARELEFSNIHTIKGNVFHILERIKQTFDIIFADPPYDLQNIDKLPDLVFEKKLLKNDGWLIIEHTKKLDFSSHQFYWQQRHYGNVHFSIFFHRS
jgi:16S rRNA (guanine(966)-N(2))-methyltransferase RsmD